MARPLRLGHAGTFCHVLARGDERRAIFRDGTDRLHSLDLLMTDGASANVPPTFVATTPQLASAAAAGEAAMGATASGQVAALVNGALHMLWVAKMKLAATLAAGVLLVSATAAGTYLALAGNSAEGGTNGPGNASGKAQDEKAAVPTPGAAKAGLAATLWTTTCEGKTPAAGALRVYHIGNSLTAGLYSYGSTEKLFSDRGLKLVRGQHLRWGKSLPWICEHPEINDAPVLPFGPWPEALAESAWDALILQPCGSALGGPQGDVAACKHFIATAAKHSPTIQVYVLATWPPRTGGKDFTQSWDRPLDDKPVPMGVPCRAYCERLVEQLNLACPSLARPVRIIPLGDVLRGLDAAAKAKGIPGVANAWQLYRGEINLGPLGCYATKCTLFAVLAGRSPVGLRNEPMKADEQAAVRKVEEVAWQIVTTHPLTGVTLPRNP